LKKAPRPFIKDYDDAVEMVLQDQVHALVADYQICLVSLFRHPDQDGHLINWVNNFLNTLKKSGELDKLRARWIEDGSWLNELP